MKGLESIIEVIFVSTYLGPDGWFFNGEHGVPSSDPAYGFKTLKELYLKANPSFNGRVTVPVLWDKKTHTIVNNESSEIIRMLYTEFDDLLPESNREQNRPGGGFYPEPLRAEIDELNDWMFRDVNIGVYKAGFATSQEVYDANITPIFLGLDRLETKLSTATKEKPYLLGEHITEPDVRLFTTLIRFDVAYHTIFMCNVKMVRVDYPNLYLWLRRLYWDLGQTTKGAFYKSSEPWMKYYGLGYTGARAGRLGNAVAIVPKGPEVLIHGLDE
jgi:glutathionyl-hydroquinone reductase